MDLTTAIDRNRTALLLMLAALFRVAGVRPGVSVTHVPRRVRCAVLHVLRPAESALRRLIVIAAQGLTVSPRPSVSPPVAPIPRGTGERLPCFALFDPRRPVGICSARHVRAPEPRISFIGGAWSAIEPRREATPDDPVPAQRLCQRLQALQHALETLPAQAKRLVRAQARRNRGADRPPLRPLRIGQPPGHRERHTHQVDEVLSDCHALALYVLTPPDTS